jgi:P-type E1-E2 ATPase
MIQVEIPGWNTLELEHLVLDLNGTAAVDGELHLGATERLPALAEHLTIHLATADTRGQAEEARSRLGALLSRIEPRAEASQKQALVERLGAANVVAIGNGANDTRMLSTAALGIAVLGPEGLAVDALRAADVVVCRIEDALDLLLFPQRLVATLRR